MRIGDRRGTANDAASKRLEFYTVRRKLVARIRQQIRDGTYPTRRAIAAMCDGDRLARDAGLLPERKPAPKLRLVRSHG